MIFDKEAYFSDPQTVTTGTDTGLTSEHVYDLGVAGREIGVGLPPLYVVVIVTTAFTSAGNNEPLAVYLLTDDNASMSSATAVDRLGVLPAAAAVGTFIVGAISPKGTTNAMERYIALQYKTEGDGTALTAGAVKAFLTLDPDRYVTYADAITVT